MLVLRGESPKEKKPYFQENTIHWLQLAVFSSLIKKNHTVALEIKTSDFLCLKAGFPFTFILRLNKTFGVKVEFNKRTT